MTELAEFRTEVRGWLAANFPGSLSGAAHTVMRSAGARATGDMALWIERIGSKGWGTPTWPKAYGGGGLTAGEAAVLDEEMRRIGAFNPLLDQGVRMLGPTLLEYGDEAQKLRHLPSITRGEVRWCQGYSEPGAGSDLASLQTKCVDAGDHWLVNGQKIWTSGAQYADWCFCLVRTDTAKKHEGISFVLINMHQPGVDPRPIRQINGEAHFCETFFTDARVEKDDLIGPLNGGWTIAKRLAQFERATHDGRMQQPEAPIHELAKLHLGAAADGRLTDPDLRARIVAQRMDAQAHDMTVRRAHAETGERVSATSSILKGSASAVSQGSAELALEVLGHDATAWPSNAGDETPSGPAHAWLSSKRATIVGGTQEIQYNIISKRILGLPEPTKAG